MINGIKRGIALLLAAICLLFVCAGAEEISVEEWLAELTAFVEETGNRTGYIENELIAAGWLEKRFEELGYTKEDGTLYMQEVPTDNEYYMLYGWEDGSINVIATKHAVCENPGILVVSAHYDTYYNTVGAKDNGSGVAALLVLAKRYAALPKFEDTEIRFVAFSCEERGGYGSDYYVYDCSDEELKRTIGVINLDVITLNEGTEDFALSCNTLGGRTAEGYTDGTSSAPVHNRISKAFEKALFEVGGFTEEQRGIDFCVPRHWGQSDCIAFNDESVDAATICFQGNLTEGGSWPSDMHTLDDVVKDFDMDRTEQALAIIDHMLNSLATDHSYGQ